MSRELPTTPPERGPRRPRGPQQGPDRGPGTRVGQLLVGWLAAGLLGWVAASWWLGQGNAVPVRAVAGLVMDVVFAVGLLVAATWVWRSARADGTDAASERRRHRGPSPQTARLVVVAAIAAAWAGSVLSGAFAGLFVAALPDADVPSVRAAVVRTGLQVLTLGVLGAAGQVAQWLCRVPPQDGDDDGRDAVRERHRHPSTPVLGRDRHG